MGKLQSRNCNVSYDASLGNRKRAYPGDSPHLMRKIARTENVDEDYVTFLKLVYKYDKNSESYTNAKCRNDGSSDEVDPEVEVEDRDGDGNIDQDDDEDPQYKMFLANVKSDGRSYVLKVDTEDGRPVFVKYEKEYGCNFDCEHLHCKTDKDIKTQKEQITEKLGKPVNVTDKEEVNVRDKEEASDDVDEDYKSLLGTIFSKKHLHCKTNKDIKTQKEQIMEKLGKPVNVDEHYKLLLETIFCKKWGMKTPLRSCDRYEHEAAEDDVEILNHRVSSSKCHDNVEDRYPQKRVRSEFRQKVMDLLKKPYSPNEYEKLWADVSGQKPIQRIMDLRNGGGKLYGTKKMGKSYLDHYEDLEKKLQDVDNDKRKKLKILRSFFFWLQNLTHEGAFKPWNDAEFLALVSGSS